MEILVLRCLELLGGLLGLWRKRVGGSCPRAEGWTRSRKAYCTPGWGLSCAGRGQAGEDWAPLPLGHSQS